MAKAMAIMLSFNSTSLLAQTRLCTREMIVGNWYWVSPPTSSVCVLRIDLDGLVTSLNCKPPLPSWGIVSQPQGNLNIDGNCKVTGTIRYTVRTSTGTSCTRSQSMNIYRAIDGSRLAGSLLLSEKCGSQPAFNNGYLNTELIFIPTFTP